MFALGSTGCSRREGGTNEQATEQRNQVITRESIPTTANWKAITNSIQRMQLASNTTPSSLLNCEHALKVKLPTMPPTATSMCMHSRDPQHVSTCSSAHAFLSINKSIDSRPTIRFSGFRANRRENSEIYAQRTPTLRPHALAHAAELRLGKVQLQAALTVGVGERTVACRLQAMLLACTADPLWSKRRSAGRHELLQSSAWSKPIELAARVAENLRRGGRLCAACRPRLHCPRRWRHARRWFDLHWREVGWWLVRGHPKRRPPHLQSSERPGGPCAARCERGSDCPWRIES